MSHSPSTLRPARRNGRDPSVGVGREPTSRGQPAPRRQLAQDGVVPALDHRDNHQDGSGHADVGLLMEGGFQLVHDVLLDAGIHARTDSSQKAASTRTMVYWRRARFIRANNVADDDGLAEGSINPDNGVLVECGVRPDNGGDNVANNDGHQALPDDGGSILADGGVLKASGVRAEGGVESGNQQDGDNHMRALEHSDNQQNDDDHVCALANTVCTLETMAHVRRARTTQTMASSLLPVHVLEFSD